VQDRTAAGPSARVRLGRAPPQRSSIPGLSGGSLAVSSTGRATNAARTRVLPIARFPPTLPASANSRSRPNATAPRHIRGEPGRGP
jgi:hypothetical protein